MDVSCRPDVNGALGALNVHPLLMTPKLHHRVYFTLEQNKSIKLVYKIVLPMNTLHLLVLAGL